MSRDQGDAKVQFLSTDGMRRRFNFSPSGGAGKVQVIATRRNEEEVQFFAIRWMRRRFSFPLPEI